MAGRVRKVRNAVGLKYVITIACAIRARSALGPNSAKTPRPQRFALSRIFVRERCHCPVETPRCVVDDNTPPLRVHSGLAFQLRQCLYEQHMRKFADVFV